MQLESSHELSSLRSQTNNTSSITFLKWLTSSIKMGSIKVGNDSGEIKYFSLEYISDATNLPIKGDLSFSPVTVTLGDHEPLDVLALWVHLDSDNADRVAGEFPLVPSCIANSGDEIDFFWKFRKDQAGDLPLDRKAERYLKKIANWFESESSIDQLVKLPEKFKFSEEEYSLEDFDFLFTQEGSSREEETSKAEEIEPDLLTTVNIQPALEIDPEVIATDDDEPIDERHLSTMVEVQPGQGGKDTVLTDQDEKVEPEPLPSPPEGETPQAHLEEQSTGEEVNEAISDLEGWIKLHRKSIRSQVFQNDGLWKVWTWCLMKANHGDRWIPIKIGKGTTEVFVQRGQFIFGREKAAMALKMDESTIYKRMMKLKKMGNCNIESNKQYSIVTIINYEFYQGSRNDEVTPEVTTNKEIPKGNNQVTTKEQPSNTNKKYLNKGKRRVKNPPDPRVNEFLNWFGEEVQRKTGVPYLIQWGKDWGKVKRALTLHDMEKLKLYAQDFLEDPQGQREGYTIGVFIDRALNRIAQKHSENPLEIAKRHQREREARGA